MKIIIAHPSHFKWERRSRPLLPDSEIYEGQAHPMLLLRYKQSQQKENNSLKTGNKKPQKDARS